MTSGDYWSSDWKDATDPVPARRELTDAQKEWRIRRLEKTRISRGYVAMQASAVSTYRVDPAFDSGEE